MVKRNPAFAALKPGYLFPEINQRKRQFLATHPEASLISLGIGDTTEPIPTSITKALEHASSLLGTVSGYSGYGPEQGSKILREKIAAVFYSDTIRPDQIFISDGAKCDIGRLQCLFGSQASIAVQDPAYPVYIEGSILHGSKVLVPLPCSPENDFFPDLKNAPKTDLIYFCSPNNPTGAASSKKQLEALVAFAKKNRSIILFDAAYAHYIRDPAIPKSIFEIAGAKEVAIEVNSFSKLAGFTGIRLGWTAIADELMYETGEKVGPDWHRLISTIFNGASCIAQAGGVAVLEKEGLAEIDRLNTFYLENAKIIKNALEKRHFTVFGGTNAPFLWASIGKRKSWEVFQEFLENYQLVITPGAGFGGGGEHFIRLSAFGHRENILKAAARLGG